MGGAVWGVWWGLYLLGVENAVMRPLRVLPLYTDEENFKKDTPTKQDLGTFRGFFTNFSMSTHLKWEPESPTTKA